MGYVWVREQHAKPYQHYHLIVFINGNQFQKAHTITKKIYSILDNLGMARTTLHIQKIAIKWCKGAIMITLLRFLKEPAT